jgi:2-dehydro-3-deoxyphosphogluconate aldolase/(4S)-4-hydroxy-2-oxoglutarate aldolase
MYVETLFTTSKHAFRHQAEDMSMASIYEILNLGPVLPVVTIDDPAHAVPLAEALLAGGIRSIEVTLRTEAGLDCIDKILSKVSGMYVGAGTVTAPEQLLVLKDMGAHFAVSPGCLPVLAETANRIGLPFLPGVMTPTEALTLREQGFQAVKFFPAEPAGGVRMVKAMSAVYPDLTFCPTGGITLEKAPEWLSLDCIKCVGGSWIAPRNAIASGDFQGITERARAAAALA